MSLLCIRRRSFNDLAVVITEYVYLVPVRIRNNYAIVLWTRILNRIDSYATVSEDEDCILIIFAFCGKKVLGMEL